MMHALLNLHEKLERVKRVFDVDQITALTIDQHYINEYYRVNKKAYDFFQRGTDFVHCAISEDGIFKKDDFFGPVRFVESYIKRLHPFCAVLELAMGRGANSAYLAQRYPSIEFYGVDISDTQLSYAHTRSHRIGNFHPLKCDMNHLRSVIDKRFDVLFIIEALCHCRNKNVIFNDIKSILAPRGVFIVIDGYRGLDFQTASIEETEAFQLMERGVAVNKFEPYDLFCSYARRHGFEIVYEEDVSKKILPYMRRHSRRADRLLRFPSMMKMMRGVFSDLFVNNFLTAEFAPYFIENGFYKHMISVFRMQTS